MQKKIEALSSRLYIQATPHKFKKTLERFDRGYLKANSWMSELCYQYIEKERRLLNDFEAMIEKLQYWVETLEESDYKEGMRQALEDAGYPPKKG